MHRREVLSIVGMGLLAHPIVAAAQQAGRVARIGYLATGTATANAALRQAFTDALREDAWIEEKNLSIEYRWDAGGTSTLDALAGELVRLPLDAVFAVNTPASLAVKRTGTRIPVVFATVSEPVAIGLVESLPRPGRNFTGFTTINRELMSKRLEILKETIPGLARLGYLANPTYEVHRPQLDEIRATAQRLRLTLHVEEVRAASQISEALARMAVAHAGAFIVQQDDLFVTNRVLVIAAAAEHRLPGMYVFSLYPRSGGLMSYGANAEDLYRRAAQHMDRILRGARPSDLPVERPVKFDLVVNLKTAEALALSIPPSVLLRADQVLQ